MSHPLPRRIALSVAAFALILFVAAPLLRADTVVLKNGDRLTGTAVKLDGGKLTFKTAYADAIAIAWDQVASLSVTQALVLPTPKGNLAVTNIERSGAGLVVTAGSGPVTLDPATVAVLRSPADQKAYEATLNPTWTHAWAGAANVSLALARGNANTTTFGAGITAARTTRTDKTSLYVNTLYGSNANSVPTTSANTSGGGISYNHNLKPRVFGFVSGDFLADALQDLDLRSIVGGGAGFHAIKSPRTTFDIYTGLVWTHESYSTVAATATTPATPPTVNSFVALDLGEQYSHKIGAASMFVEQAYVYPDLNSLGQYQFTMNTTFSTKLGKMFNWNTTASDNYTSFPPTGTLSNDFILTTGLGLNLARP